MARNWRRAVLAASAAAMLAGPCAIGAGAWAAEGEVQDSSAAQRRIEAALEDVRAGRTEQAVRAMSSTLESGNLPPALLAKAFYVRGLAYRRQGKPAEAVSDLSSALWLRGGLGVDDRADALKERAAAYADAGLPDPAGAPQPPTAKTASGGGWLSNVFGSSSTPAPPASTSQPRRSAPPPAPQTAAAVPAEGWASSLEVQPSTTASVARRPPQERRASVPGEAAGRYLVQVGALRTEAKAQALADRARREHATLATLSHSIDRVEGSKGTFYRVRFGPFASASETQSVCATLQDKGQDCLPVTR